MFTLLKVAHISRWLKLRFRALLFRDMNVIEPWAAPHSECALVNLKKKDQNTVTVACHYTIIYADKHEMHLVPKSVIFFTQSNDIMSQFLYTILHCICYVWEENGNRINIFISKVYNIFLIMSYNYPSLSWIYVDSTICVCFAFLAVCPSQFHNNLVVNSCDHLLWRRRGIT